MSKHISKIVIHGVSGHEYVLDGHFEDEDLRMFKLQKDSDRCDCFTYFCGGAATTFYKKNIEAISINRLEVEEVIEGDTKTTVYLD